MTLEQAKEISTELDTYNSVTRMKNRLIRESYHAITIDGVTYTLTEEVRDDIVAALDTSATRIYNRIQATKISY